MSDDTPSAIVLKWPRAVTITTGIAGVIGAYAFYDWLSPAFAGEPLQKANAFHFIACLLFLPVGIGFSIMSLQTVVVTQDYIENRHLGFRRRLNLSTSRIDRIYSNGFRIVDGDGKRLMINQWLIGSNELYAMIGAGSRWDVTSPN